MKPLRLLLLCLLTLPMGLRTSERASGAVFVPSGLSAGDNYHLVFVTDGTTQAQSDQISTYNSFVNLEAERAGATTEGWNLDWRAIGSTASVNANVNASVTAPVYLLNGTLVADGFDDLWDGTIAAPISLDQFGNTVVDRVWSGASFDGGPASFDATLGEFFIRTGEAGNTIGWIAGLLEEGPNDLNRMYAMSPQLTVSAVPEPGVVFGLLLGSLSDSITR